ncbi:hypothetical protein KIL84_023288 [Mauremys mutica]|uniref:Uncharacterized protein n=1 Tax=Mauremys mutica TaxID=74926 RepID=A0A9D3WLX8_9SAUR|nr:hypothetical protein KIL84_023288 [Mauremys mutica]
MFCGKISLSRREGEKRETSRLGGLDITLPNICMDLKTTLSVKVDGAQGGTKQGQLKHILLKQNNTSVARAEGNALF